MATVYEEVCSVFKTKPKSTEGMVLFGKRIAKKINDLEDAEYKRLSKATQEWSNAFLKGIDDHLDQEAMPTLPGWPQPEETHEDEEGDDEASAEEAEAEDENSEDDQEEQVSKKPKVKKGAAKKKAAPAKSPAKKAVAKKATAKKAAANGTAHGAGRKGSFDLQAKIKVLAKENPRREGSAKFELFKKYKTGMTVEQALDAGIPWGMLRKDAAKKNISIG